MCINNEITVFAKQETLLLKCNNYLSHIEQKSIKSDFILSLYNITRSSSYTKQAVACQKYIFASKSATIHMLGPRAFYWLNINARGAWCTWCHLWRESLVNFQRRLSRSCVWETVDGMWQKGQGRTRVKWVETRRDGSTSPDQSVAPQQPFVRPLETERLRGGNRLISIRTSMLHDPQPLWVVRLEVRFRQ